MSNTLYRVHRIDDEFEGGPALLVDFQRGVSGCSMRALAKLYRLYWDASSSKNAIECMAIPSWDDIPPVTLDASNFLGSVKPADVGGDAYRDGGRVLEVCRKFACQDAEEWLDAVVKGLMVTGLVFRQRKRESAKMEEDKGCCVVQ